MSYPFIPELSAAEEPASYIIVTEREDWGCLQPNPDQITTNILKYIDWVKKYRLPVTESCMLAFKKGITLGFRYEDFYNYVYFHKPFGDLDDNIKVQMTQAKLDVVFPLNVYGSVSSRASSTTTSCPNKKKRRKRNTKQTTTLELKDLSNIQMDTETIKAAISTAESLSEDIDLDDQVPPPGDQKEIDKVQEPSNKLSKPRPIMVTGISCDALRELATKIDKTGEVEFTVAKAGNLIKVMPETHWDKIQLMDILETLQIQFYVIPDNEPVLKVVIGSIDATPEEIKDYLSNSGYNVLQVNQLTSRRDKKPLPLFQVQLPRSKKAESIYQLKSMFRVKVRVTKYRPPKKALQCYRCNGFHHIAKNCHIKPRCGICSSEHESRDCPRKQIKTEERPPPVCSNCGGPHVASFKGCKDYPDRPSYAQIAQKKKGNKVPERKTSNKQTDPQPGMPKKIQESALEIKKVTAELQKELQVNDLADILSLLKQTLEAVRSVQGLGEKRLAFVESLNSSPLLPYPTGQAAETQ